MCIYKTYVQYNYILHVEIDRVLVLKSNTQISKRLISYALNGHIVIGIIKNIVLFMVLREFTVDNLSRFQLLLVLLYPGEILYYYNDKINRYTPFVMNNHRL